MNQCLQKEAELQPLISTAIYVLGGERRQGTFDNNERFDPINTTWTIEKSMPAARHGFGVASIDDQIYVIGGDQIQD